MKSIIHADNKEVFKMSMTNSRRSVYRRKWYKRECKITMKLNRKIYNRKIRHSKIDPEDYTSRDYKNIRKLTWNTKS